MKRYGFSIMGMMITISIVVILAAVAIPNFLAYRYSSHVGVCKTNMNIIARASEMHYLKTGHVETDISALCSKSRSGGHLRSVPVCPIGGTYILSFDSVEQKFHVECSRFDEETHNVSQDSDD